MRRGGWLALVVLAFLAGGVAPARAGVLGVDGDRIIQLLDRISDSIRDIAHREPVHVVCECRSGS